MMLADLGITYRELCRRQVIWYQAHGNYRSRVAIDSDGIRYVIGDWSWNYNKLQTEFIEGLESFQALERYVSK